MMINEDFNSEELLLAGLLNNVEDCFFVKDLNFNYIYVNDSYCHFLHKHRSEIIGKCDRDLLPEIYAIDFEIHDKNIIQSKQSLVSQQLIEIHNRSRWVEIAKYPVLNSNGDVSGIRGKIKDISNIKIREEQLLSEIEKYKKLTENITDVIWELDINMNFTYISPSVEQLVGYKPEEVIGMNMFGFVKPVYLEHLKQQQKIRFERFQKTGKAEPAIYEVEVKNKKGEYIWVEIATNPKIDVEGKFSGYRGVNRNITSRKMAEFALSKRNSKLLEINEFSSELAYLPYQDVFPYIVKRIRELFNVKAAWVTSFDETTSDLVVQHSSLDSDETNRIMKLLGKKIKGFRTHITPEQYLLITNERFRQLYSFHELTFGAVPYVIGKAAEKLLGIGWFVGLALMHQEKLVGTLILVGDSGQPPTDKEEILAFSGIVANALGRKKAEEGMYNTMNKWQTTFDGIKDGIMILDGEGRIIQVNKASKEIWGFNDGEFIGRACWDMVVGNDKNIEGCPFQLMLKTQRRESMILPINDKWYEVSVDPIMNEDNEIETVIHIMSDITARKLAEEERSRLIDIIESTTDLVSIAKPDGKLIYLNQAGRQMTGWGEHQELNDKFIQDIHPDWAYQKIKNEAIPATINNNVWKGETAIIDINGNDKFVSQIIMAHKTETGNLQFLSTIMRDITDRKEFEEAIKESEERYRSFIEQTLEGVSLIDESGKILIWNSANERISGISKENAIGKYMWDVMYDLILPAHRFPERYEEIKNRIIESLKTGEPSLKGTREIKTIKADGTIKFTRQIIFPIKTAKGYRFGTISHDITEQKLAEESLDESRQMLRQILDTIPVRVFWKNLDLNFLGCNMPFALDAGLDSPEALIGKSDFDLVWEDHAQKYRADDRQVIESGIPKLRYEESQTNPDGKTTWLITNKIPLRDTSGNIKGVLGTYEDITEIKKAEIALQQSEYRIRTLSDNLPDGLIYQATEAPDGRRYFTHISAGIEKMHGITAADVLKNAELLYNQIHEDDYQKVVEEEIKSAKLIIPFNMEIRFRTPNRGLRWAIVRSAPRIMPDGSTVWEGIEIDLTEKKHAEEQIRILNAELEKKVELRTLELKNTLAKLKESNEELQMLNDQVLQDSEAIMQLNEELIGSQEKLQEALETKDRFFSILAHDLKNPFVVLLNNSELLQNHYIQLDDEAKLKLIRDIRLSSKSTYSLLENLLKWSRSQMGQLAFIPEEVDIYELALNVTFILKSQSNQKNILLTLNCEPDTIAICDRDMIETVFRNLVSNAIKFSNPGSEINIEVASSADDPNFLKISIHDHGIGIPNITLKKLFNLAENVTRSGTQNEKGTGLGLLLCKDFVEKHGGKLWVESKEGVGSVFFFTVPKYL